MKSNLRKRTFLVLLAVTVMWMCVIFGFSSSTAEQSTVQSNAVTEFMIRIFEGDFESLEVWEQQELIERYDGIFRKLAHFCVYAVLGGLVYWTVGSLKSLPDEKITPIKLSLPISVVYAISDEIHQVFVPGRAGRITDVLIDSAGIVSGTLAAVFVTYVLFDKLMAYKNNK